MKREESWLLQEKYSGVKTEAFWRDVERLTEGEPLAYVIGRQPFGDLRIHLDSKPLIPRTETEYWVTEVLKNIREDAVPKNVLDLCAGSGCIGALALYHFPSAQVDFEELDETHHNTIEKNIRENNLPIEHVRIFGGDLFEEVPGDARYDIIFTNPPYIDPALDRTETSVKVHEPHMALYGGEDGMELIERIIAEAPQHLTARGTLYIEHEPEQSDTIAAHAKKHGFSTTVLCDQYNTQRVSRLVRE